MPGIVRGHLLIDRYAEVVADLYIEPKDKDIIGSFFNKDLLHASEPGHVVQKEITKHTSKVVNENRDIREMVKKYK